MKMSIYLYLLYFVAMYFFVTFSQFGSALTEDQYKTWKCDRICEVGELANLVSKICYKLFLLLKEEIQDPYSEEKVKELSKCEANVSVLFENGPEKEPKWHQVGMCRLGEKSRKCITMGKGEKEVMVYSFGGDGCVLSDLRYELKIEDVPPESSNGWSLKALFSYFGL